MVDEMEIEMKDVQSLSGDQPPMIAIQDHQQDVSHNDGQADLPGDVQMGPTPHFEDALADSSLPKSSSIAVSGPRSIINHIKKNLSAMLGGEIEHHDLDLMQLQKEDQEILEETDESAMLVKDFSGTNDTLEQGVEEMIDENESVVAGKVEREKERNQLYVENLHFRDENRRLQDQLTGLRAEKTTWREEWKQVQRQRREDRESIRSLQEEVARCKIAISKATRPIDNDTDDTIKEQFDLVFRDARAFVVSQFRKFKFDFARVPDGWKDWMSERVSQENIPSGHHTYNICVSVLAGVLMEHGDLTYKFGMSNKEPLASMIEVLTNFRPSEKEGIKTWIRQTRQLVAVNDSEMLAEAESELARHMAMRVEEVLLPSMQAEWNEEAHNELAGIMCSGWKFLQSLHDKPAMYAVEMPRATVQGQHQHVVPVWMQDVEGVEDDKTLAAQLIAFPVFPLVSKTGDERGENLNLTSVVCKARVVARGVPSKKLQWNLRRKNFEYAE